MSKRQKYSILNIFLTLVLVGLIGIGVTKGDRAKADFDPEEYITLQAGSIVHNGEDNDTLSVAGLWNTDPSIEETHTGEIVVTVNSGSENQVVDTITVPADVSTTGTWSSDINIPTGDLTHQATYYVRASLKLWNYTTEQYVEVDVDDNQIWHVEDENTGTIAVIGLTPEIEHAANLVDTLNIELSAYDLDHYQNHYPSYVTRVDIGENGSWVSVYRNVVTGEGDLSWDLAFADIGAAMAQALPDPSASPYAQNKAPSITPIPGDITTLKHQDSYQIRARLYACQTAACPIGTKTILLDTDTTTLYHGVTYEKPIEIIGTGEDPVVHDYTPNTPSKDELFVTVSKEYPLTSPFPVHFVRVRGSGMSSIQSEEWISMLDGENWNKSYLAGISGTRSEAIYYEPSTSPAIERIADNLYPDITPYPSPWGQDVPTREVDAYYEPLEIPHSYNGYTLIAELYKCAADHIEACVGGGFYSGWYVGYDSVHLDHPPFSPPPPTPIPPTPDPSVPTSITPAP